MRFKLPPNRLVIVIIFATYVLYLGFNSQLKFYIHPRYVVFTFSMAAIGLLLALMDGYFDSKSSVKKHNHSKQSKIIHLPMYFIIAVALFIPARSLTSATISQRAADTGSIISTSESKPLTSLFSGSSKGLSISDWSRIIDDNKDSAYYANKPVKISGFVYDGNLGDNVMLLARFVVTCCAVDAVPVTVPVEIANWQSEYEQDEWLEVEGYFEEIITSKGEALVLVPSSVIKIEQPSNPYAN